MLFGGGLILDNTPSNASIIPDDEDDAMHAGDAKQGAENCRKRRGNQGNRSDWKSPKLNMKRALERKPKCRKMNQRGFGDVETHNSSSVQTDKYR